MRLTTNTRTDTNPFSLDALAVFMFRVLQRVIIQENLDKASPNAGYVLLMFYHLYEGKSRKEFESELIERFGSLVKMPLLKPDRYIYVNTCVRLPFLRLALCPGEGIDLYKLHTKRHGRKDKMGETTTRHPFWNADYLNSVQASTSGIVRLSLLSSKFRRITEGAKGITYASYRERKLEPSFAALSLPVTEIHAVLNNLAKKDPKIEAFLKDKKLENLNRAHLTLAHKRSHGIKAVADYGLFLHKKVPVELTALLYSDKMAAFEAFPGSVEGEKIDSKNEWPHVTYGLLKAFLPKRPTCCHICLQMGKQIGLSSILPSIYPAQWSSFEHSVPHLPFQIPKSPWH
ncbi:uncharacterized protein DS421_3g61520 [Arachis hypogaea]|nr:uncharacterized protein DS421_3g61520 [Arachis hypogaea]